MVPIISPIIPFLHISIPNEKQHVTKFHYVNTLNACNHVCTTSIRLPTVITLRNVSNSACITY